MPVYKDNAANRKLGRVGKEYGKIDRSKPPPPPPGAPPKKKQEKKPILSGDMKRNARIEAQKKKKKLKIVKKAVVKPAREKKAVKTTTLDSGAYKAQFGKRPPFLFNIKDRKKQSDENKAGMGQFNKGKQIARIAASKRGDTPQRKKRKDVARSAAYHAREKGFGKGVPTKKDIEDEKKQKEIDRKKREKEMEEEIREAIESNRNRDYAKEYEKEIRAKQKRANTVKYGNRRKR